MLVLEGTMRNCLREDTRVALGAYSEKGREKWFFEWPAQCVLTVDQIVWQVGVTNALNAINDGSDGGCRTPHAPYAPHLQCTSVDPQMCAP